MSLSQVPLGAIIRPATLRRAGSNKHPILSMTMRNGLVDQEQKFKKRIASNDLAQYKVVDRGQLVVGFPIDEGVLAFQSTYASAIVSPAYNVWDLTDPAKVDRSYLQRYLRSPAALKYYASKLRGTTARRRTLPADIFLALPVPIPSIEEQRRIAELLDRADELRAKRRESLAYLDDLPQAIFLEMFGDPVSNRLGWPVKRLADVGLLERGVSTHRPRNDPRLLGGPYPLIQTGDVANSGGYIENHKSTYSEIGLRQSRLWPQGTLCITIAANIAKTGILTFDACFPDSVVGFTAPQSTTLYIQTWLSFLQESLERLAPESAQKNINLAILRELPVISPPTKLLDQFAERMSAVEALRASQRASLAELDALFASLQDRAFRGLL